MNSDVKLDPFVAYFRTKLSGLRVTEPLIDETVNGDVIVKSLDESQVRRIKRILKFELNVTQEIGSLITDDARVSPWIDSRTPPIDYYYWGRLRKYFLEQSVLPASVVSTLDSVSKQILDCCHDPEIPGTWRSRGMVIGHVQSGKTTNYAAVITKAADAGYKVIILLAGITNKLRSQTQERLDEYFIGRKSVFNAAAQAPLPIINYGPPPLRQPAFGTSRDSDFNRQNAQVGAGFSSLKEPIIFIIKKNKSVLVNLHTWIQDQEHGGLSDVPLLLIDDEADNASINTHEDPDRSTAINELIRQILARFTRSTFIGYTATPFANIFIDPNSADEFNSEDLFPRNFIKALDPPSNYCGAARYFSKNGDLSSSVSIVSDYQDILPLNHKKDHPVNVLPRSLFEAVRCFVLAASVRDLRDDGKKHATMMINVSRFNDVQESVEGQVYAYMSALSDAVLLWGGIDGTFTDRHMLDLEATYKRHYKHLNLEDAPLDFRTLLPYMQNTVKKIFVTTVNMRKRDNRLDYGNYAENGIHVIAIGGLALSRGLTLEGLVVSYILRNVATADTLMQMGRWFGYRTNYEDLCKIFLTQDCREDFAEAFLSIEELQEEVNLMEDSKSTPIEFGLKVRQSATGIKITAANKMRTATSIKLAAGYSGKYIQGHCVRNDEKVNQRNKSVLVEFLNSIKPNRIRTDNDERVKSDADGNFYWSNVDVRKILSVMEGFEFPEGLTPFLKVDGKRSLLHSYINDRKESELAEWDVAIFGRKIAAADTPSIDDFLKDEKINPVTRTAAKLSDDGRDYQFTGGSRSLGDHDTHTILLSDPQKEEARNLKVVRSENRYCAVRKSPLLVIFAVKTIGKLESSLGDVAYSFSVSMPLSGIEVKEHEYHINRVLQEQLRFEGEQFAEDDETALEDGNI